MPFFLNARPTYATPKVLEKAGLSLDDIDVFEFHEAFAVSLYVIDEKLQKSHVAKSIPVLVITN